MSNHKCTDENTGTLFANPDDCSRFYICVKGTPWEQECPKGQLWEDTEKWCDVEENVECGDRPIVPVKNDIVNNVLNNK